MILNVWFENLVVEVYMRIGWFCLVYNILYVFGI